MARRTAYLAIPIIAGIVSSTYLVGFVLTLLLGLPWDLGLPWGVRMLGLPLMAYGVVLLVWVFRFRDFGDVLESTYVTLLKILRRLPVEAPATRTEPLVVAGPYRLVRHPLYSGVIGLSFGIGFLVDHPWALLGALALWSWFALVVAPFEERELIALFGPDYVEYMQTHYRFLPLPRRGGGS